MDKRKYLLNLEAQFQEARFDIQVLQEVGALCVTIPSKEAGMLALYDLNFELKLYAMSYKCGAIFLFVQELDQTRVLLMPSFFEADSKEEAMKLLNMINSHKKTSNNYPKVSHNFN